MITMQNELLLSLVQTKMFDIEKNRCRSIPSDSVMINVTISHEQTSNLMKTLRNETDTSPHEYLMKVQQLTIIFHCRLLESSKKRLDSAKYGSIEQSRFIHCHV
jgi:hypothetical protein